MPTEQKRKPVPPLGGRSSKRKKIKLPEYSKLNKEVIRALDIFLESTSTKRLSRNLRDMFLTFLALEGNELAEEFKELPTDLYFLLQFLDVAADEISEG